MLPELKIELILAGALYGHRQRVGLAARRAGDVGAKLLVDQYRAALPRGTIGDSPHEPLIDQRLELRDALAFGRRGFAGDPHQPLLERAAVVEGEHVQSPAEAHRHGGSASSSEPIA